ncbi:MAG: S-methyl-5-thioribose-1-phosphate isomerase [Bacteroidales bacterium]|nr:S-methyl-5-thioribose-1-phosphate isomerase [Bacteroidales bacterium]
MKNILEYDAVEMSENGRDLIVLDQSVLPAQQKFLHLTTAEQMFYAMTLLKVRGAPLLGITAAMGLAVCMNRFKTKSVPAFEKEFLRVKHYLYISRKTPINLTWALDRMERCFYSGLEELAGTDSEEDMVRELKLRLTAEARSIKQEDTRMCLDIAEAGLAVLRAGAGILTYGNAGHLASSHYGTALGPIYHAQHKGYMPRVYACETRPGMEGARLTAFELMKAGVDVTLVCDNMVADLMSRGKVNVVFLGCDRVAANGDVAAEVGTCSIAIIARHYDIPCYCLTPTSSIDFETASGREIEIEQNPAFEVTERFFDKPVSPKGVKVYNPTFDITPASILTGFITEKGIVKPSKLATLKG